MKNRTITRTNARTYSFLRAKTLILAGFAMMLALGTSSLALYTRTAATQELDKNMPTLNGDAAVEYLKKEATYGSLAEAIASRGDDNLSDSPEAVTKLTASDGAANDTFGYSVAISGDTAIVSAAGDTNGTNQRQGSAYIFSRTGTAWTQGQKFLASDGAAGDFFGTSVSISGSTAIVGALGDTIGANSFQGSAYVFTSSATVSGRVLTPDGRNLRNAIVSLIDSQGVRRTATSSSFGVYSFADVRTGDTYTLTVSSKRYRFTPLIMPINDNLANLDFVGLE